MVTRAQAGDPFMRLSREFPSCWCTWVLGSESEIVQKLSSLECRDIGGNSGFECVMARYASATLVN